MLKKTKGELANLPRNKLKALTTTIMKLDRDICNTAYNAGATPTTSLTYVTSNESMDATKRIMENAD